MLGLMTAHQQKQVIIDSLAEKIAKANGIYLVGFEKMTVAETIDFRRKLKAKGLEYIVAKNTLIRRAFDQVGGEQTIIPKADYFGQSGLVFSYDDALTPAKIIKEVSEKTERPALKAALVENQYYHGSKLKEIAALPSRAELIASILGSLNAPISGIVGSINATIRDLASVIEEVAKSKNAA